MSWSITVNIDDGQATVSHTPNIKDGTYTIGGHEHPGGVTSVYVGATSVCGAYLFSG
jgi:metallophosphoesterase superfamily enzyme